MIQLHVPLWAEELRRAVESAVDSGADLEEINHEMRECYVEAHRLALRRAERQVRT